MRRLEQREPGLRTLGRLARVDEADAVGGADQIAADRRRRRPQRPAQRAVDGARVAEVVAHEALDALARRRAGVAQHVGGALLQLVAEDVVVPLRLEVQDRAHAQQELLGVLERARTRRRPAPRSAGSVSIAIVCAPNRSRRPPGASFTSGSS